jgi:hypothetical protein
MAIEDVQGVERLVYMGGSFFALPFNNSNYGLDNNIEAIHLREQT